MLYYIAQFVELYDVGVKYTSRGTVRNKDGGNRRESGRALKDLREKKDKLERFNLAQ